MIPRATLCPQQTVIEIQGKGYWQPDQVFKGYVVVYVTFIMNERWMRQVLFESSSKSSFNKCTTSRSMSLLEIPIQQSVREIQREVDEGRPLEDTLCIDYYNNNHFLHTSTASDLDCCFMAILSQWKPPGPRMMRTLWSNSRERMENYQKRKDGGGSFPEGLDIMLKETATRNLPTSETADSPENEPQDHDVRQSERVLKFQNRDFWIRPNRFVLALSHTRDFKNYRGTSS